MKEIKHVFFDLDHTLWDFETNSDQAYRRVFDEEGLAVDFDRFMQVYHPINQQCWEDYAAGKVTKDDVKYNRLRRALEQMDIRLPAEVYRRMAERYGQYLSQGTALCEGAKEILDYLKDKYTLHLLSNGFAEVQYPKIERSGLQDYFRTITLSEETGRLKPHPSVFRHALQKAGALAHESVMIGDSFGSDITGALNMGMQAVFYDPHHSRQVPETIAPTVRRLEELKKIL